MTTPTCPACGLGEFSGESCQRCGVVFAKFRARPPRARSPTSRSPESPASLQSSSRAWVLLLIVGFGATLVSFYLLGRRSLQADPPSAGMRPVVDAPPPLPTTAAIELPADLVPPAGLAPDLPEGAPAAGLSTADRATAEALNQMASSAHQPISDLDLARAEELAARHPDDSGLRTLVAGLHLRLALQLQASRNYEAARQQARLATLDARLASQALALLISVELETGEWSSAESAARELLQRLPDDLDSQRSLAYALFRQDRNREARQVLETLLASREDGQARALLARLLKLADDERGMTEQRLAHFNVRYDGGEHEDVGREILRALERHYATLRSQLDHEIAATVPVILFSQQDYYQANGMPAWAGGHYDNTDGRIRIPIRGLTSALSPDLDGTLLHELTHAFVADRSRGLAPRELHEGLAQYMEGKRVDELLGREQLEALADGRGRGVAGFYLEALAFVEYLVKVRGQGGINDLLVAMGETGSVDQAFSQVYGRDFAGTQAEWRQRFQRAEGH